MNSTEYDKIVSDTIEQEFIDTEKLCEIDDSTIIKHLLCTLMYNTSYYEEVHIDYEGNKYRITINEE